MKRRVRFAGGATSCLAALLSLSSCASESRRLAAEEAGAAEAPAPGQKTRVTVTSVDIGRGATSGKAVLTVRAIPPNTGWTIEIRPLAATTEETMEFEVVGRGPAATSSHPAKPQVLTAEIEVGGAVKHVVVYDEDDATVLETP